MRTKHGVGLAAAVWMGAGCGAAAGAQQPVTQAVGQVQLKDVSVSGSLEATGGEALLRGGTTIQARDHTAEMRLTRGGEVQLCATSMLHVTTGPASKEGEGPTALLLALDRGRSRSTWRRRRGMR